MFALDQVKENEQLRGTVESNYYRFRRLWRGTNAKRAMLIPITRNCNLLIEREERDADHYFVSLHP